MATRYASLARCSDLPERDVIAALLSHDECAALLERIATMAPRAASRALFGLLARLATPACTWLDGELAVELFEEAADAQVRVRVMSEIGGGYRERVLPVVVFAHTLAELMAGISRQRDIAGLLRIERVSSRCVLLLASEERGPVATQFDISETSLAWTSGPAATPEEVDSGWDDSTQTT